MRRGRGPLEQTKEGCHISIEVRTDARRTEIVGSDPWRGSIKVSVAAPRVSGAANRELVEFFEGLLPEARGAVRISAGGRSRTKRLFVPLDEKTVRERLGLKDAERG